MGMFIYLWIVVFIMRVVLHGCTLLVNGLLVLLIIKMLIGRIMHGLICVMLRSKLICRIKEQRVGLTRGNMVFGNMVAGVNGEQRYLFQENLFILEYLIHLNKLLLQDGLVNRNIILCPRFKIRTTCPKCASPNARYVRSGLDLEVHCICGYLKVVFSLLGQLEEHHNGVAVAKLPRPGTHLRKTLMAVECLEEANTADIAQRLIDMGLWYSMSDVASYLTILRSKGLVEQLALESPLLT